MAQLAEPSVTAAKRTISKLVKLWTPYHRGSLEVRHETGRVLNDLVGPPSQRQPYGEGVLTQVAKQIGVSRSEISRMRKFAEAIPDLRAFRRDNPTCNTWTKVKVHLATIGKGGQPDSDTARPASPTVRACKSIRSLVKKVKRIEPVSKRGNRKQVVDALEELANALREAFHVRLQVVEHSKSTRGRSGTRQSAA